MSNWTREHEQRGLEKGLKKGLEEGRRVGRQQGKAEALLILVETRFGALSPKRRDRIRSADIGTLEIWLDRFAEGADRRSIFTGRRPSAKVIAFPANPPRTTTKTPTPPAR